MGVFKKLFRILKIAIFLNFLGIFLIPGNSGNFHFYHFHLN
jgi:hypothetical protein